MPRCEKGILGVKKDRKKQMLFTFGVRKGEEWDSDSDDPDFTLTKEEMEEVEIR